MKTSLVIPFRFTSQEVLYAEQTLPAYARLGFNEIVIGIDMHAAVQVQKRLLDALLKGQNYKTVMVARDPQWNMHLAHVLYDCYRACTHNYVCTSYIDLMPYRSMMPDYPPVGSGVGLVSYGWHCRADNMQERIRALVHRIKIWRGMIGPSGTFWAWLPYLQAINEERYQDIQNGADTYIIEDIRQKTQVHHRSQPICRELDLAHNDQPWVQFHFGIWLYAHRRRRLPWLRPLARAMANQHWVILEGYLWAREHQGSELVAVAGTLTRDQWVYRGSADVKALKDWGVQPGGYHGTGF